MALTPRSPDNPDDKRTQQKSAQDEALLREVDDAYRQGQYAEFSRKYGRPLLGLLILGLAAFGGYLYWDHRQELSMANDSERIVAAMDQIQAGNFDTGSKTLEEVANSENAGASAAARLLQAGIAAQQDQPKQAAELFASVAGDESAPVEMRNLAAIREIALTFDDLEPGEVVRRLKPLAVPGNAWFGSAGELVAMAYLRQDNRQQAGTLFAEIAKSEDVPDSLRSRTRQMAGLLGVDAIEDVDALLAQQADGATPQGATVQ